MFITLNLNINSFIKVTETLRTSRKYYIIKR